MYSKMLVTLDRSKASETVLKHIERAAGPGAPPVEIVSGAGGVDHYSRPSAWKEDYWRTSSLAPFRICRALICEAKQMGDRVF
jgi:hypothetical protein